MVFLNDDPVSYKLGNARLDLREWYMQKKGITLERGEIMETINQLYKMKVADFENGKICLKEKVWGNWNRTIW